MRPFVVASAAPFALAVALHAGAARADLTSWFAVGGGASAQREIATDTFRGSGAVTATVGVGTTPRHPVVVGGVFRLLAITQQGADVAVAARVCTRGFARGDWGLALDVGPEARTWAGGKFGRWPLLGVITVGAPWGVGLAAGATAFDLGGQPAARGGFVALELDFLRLSVMRTGSTEQWWRNPSPAGGRSLPE